MSIKETLEFVEQLEDKADDIFVALEELNEENISDEMFSKAIEISKDNIDNLQCSLNDMAMVLRKLLAKDGTN